MVLLAEALPPPSLGDAVVGVEAEAPLVGVGERLQRRDLHEVPIAGHSGVDKRCLDADRGGRPDQVREPRPASRQRMPIRLAVEAHVPAQRPVLERAGPPGRLGPGEAVRGNGGHHQLGVRLAGRSHGGLDLGQRTLDIQYDRVEAAGQLCERSTSVDNDARRVGPQVLPGDRDLGAVPVGDETHPPQCRTLRRLAHNDLGASHRQQPSAIRTRPAVTQIQYSYASHIAPESPTARKPQERTHAPRSVLQGWVRLNLLKSQLP